MTNYHKVYLITLIIVGTIFIVAIYLFMNRYEIVSNERDLPYKLDKLTGEMWTIYKDEFIKLTTREEEKELVGDELAIEIVKKDKVLNSHEYFPSSNESQIIKDLKSVAGSINIYGWQARLISMNTYLVSFEFSVQGIRLGYFFEVELTTNLVRDVLKDDYLKKKYEEYIPSIDSLQEFYLYLVQNNLVSGLPIEYEVFKRTLINPVKRKHFYETLLNNTDISKGLLKNSFEEFSEYYFDSSQNSNN